MTTSFALNDRGRPFIHYTYTEESDQTEMPSRAQGLSGLLRLSGVVAAAGLALPEAYTAMRDRFLTFSTAAANHSPVLLDRLCKSLIDGTGDPHLLFAAAMAGAGAGHVERRAEVLSQVHDQMAHTLRGLYAPVAESNYRQLAQRFNQAAERFTRCAGIVAPGAAPEEVISANTKTLTAWRDAETVAAELDGLVEPLSAAAELLRGLGQPSGLGNSRDPFLLPLCADVDGIHARVAWHSWRDWAEPKPPDQKPPGLTLQGMKEPAPDTVQHTRGGRWTRLHRCGADIRAHQNPTSMGLFGRPAPIGVAPVFHRELNRETLDRFDPCGPLPVEAPKRRLRDLFRRTPGEAPAPEPEPDILDTVAGPGDDDGEDRS